MGAPRKFTGQDNLIDLTKDITGQHHDAGMCRGIVMGFAMSSLQGSTSARQFTTVIKDSIKSPEKVKKSSDKKQVVAMMSEYQKLSGNPALCQPEIIGTVTEEFMGHEFAQQLAIVRPDENGIGCAEEKVQMNEFTENLSVLFKNYVSAREHDAQLPDKSIFTFTIRSMDLSNGKRDFHNIAVMYDANNTGNEWTFIEPNSLKHYYYSNSNHIPYFCASQGDEEKITSEMVYVLSDIYGIDFRKLEEPRVQMSIDEIIFKMDQKNPAATFDSMNSFTRNLGFNRQNITRNYTADDSVIDARYWVGENHDPEPAIDIEKNLTREIVEHAFKDWESALEKNSAHEMVDLWYEYQRQAYSWIKMLEWIEVNKGDHACHDILVQWHIKYNEYSDKYYGNDDYEIPLPENTDVGASRRNDVILEEKSIDTLSDESAQRLREFACETQLATDNRDFQKIEMLHQLIRQNVTILEQSNRSNLAAEWMSLASNIESNANSIIQDQQTAESHAKILEYFNIANDAIQRQDIATLDNIYNEIAQFIVILIQNNRQDLANDWDNLANNIKGEAQVIQEKYSSLTQDAEMKMEVDFSQDPQSSTQTWCGMYYQPQNDLILSNTEEYGIPQSSDDYSDLTGSR